MVKNVFFEARLPKFPIGGLDLKALRELARSDWARPAWLCLTLFWRDEWNLGSAYMDEQARYQDVETNWGLKYLLICPYIIPAFDPVMMPESWDELNKVGCWRFYFLEEIDGTINLPSITYKTLFAEDRYLEELLKMWLIQSRTGGSFNSQHNKLWLHHYRCRIRWVCNR